MHNNVSNLKTNNAIKEVDYLNGLEHSSSICLCSDLYTNGLDRD
jgi:hypothetical protein